MILLAITIILAIALYEGLAAIGSGLKDIAQALKTSSRQA